MGLIKFVNEQVKNHRINKIQRLLRTRDLCNIDSLKYELTIKTFDGANSTVNNPILQQTKKNTYKAVTSQALGYSFIVVDIVKSPIGIVPDNDNGRRVFPVPGFIVNNITEFGDYGMLIISATSVDDDSTYIFVRNIFEMSQLWGLTCISSTYLKLPMAHSMWRIFFDETPDSESQPNKFVVLKIEKSNVWYKLDVIDYVYTDGVVIKTGQLQCSADNLSLLSIDTIEKVMTYCDDQGSVLPFLSGVLRYARGGLSTKDLYY